MSDRSRQADLEKLLAGGCSQEEYAMWESQLGSEVLQKILRGDELLRSAIAESVLEDPRMDQVKTLEIIPKLTRPSLWERMLSTWGLWIGLTILTCGLIAVVPLLVSWQTIPFESGLDAVGESLLTPLTLGVMAAIAILVAAAQWIDAGESF